MLWKHCCCVTGQATCSWAAVISSHHNLLQIWLQSKDCSKQLVNQKPLKDTLHCNRILGIFLLYKQIHANQKVKCVWCTEHFVFFITCISHYLGLDHTLLGVKGDIQSWQSTLQWQPPSHLWILNATAVQKYKSTMKWTRLLLSLLHQGATTSLPNENQESSSCKFGGVVSSMVQVAVNHCGQIPQFKV